MTIKLSNSSFQYNFKYNIVIFSLFTDKNSNIKDHEFSNKYNFPQNIEGDIKLGEIVEFYDEENIVFGIALNKNLSNSVEVELFKKYFDKIIGILSTMNIKKNIVFPLINDNALFDNVFFKSECLDYIYETLKKLKWDAVLYSNNIDIIPKETELLSFSDSIKDQLPVLIGTRYYINNQTNLLNELNIKIHNQNILIKKLKNEIQNLKMNNATEKDEDSNYLNELMCLLEDEYNNDVTQLEILENSGYKDVTNTKSQLQRRIDIYKKVIRLQKNKLFV